MAWVAEILEIWLDYTLKFHIKYSVTASSDLNCDIFFYHADHTSIFRTITTKFERAQMIFEPEKH